jgi:hypothetical protein
VSREQTEGDSAKRGEPATKQQVLEHGRLHRSTFVVRLWSGGQSTRAEPGKHNTTSSRPACHAPVRLTNKDDPSGGNVG